MREGVPQGGVISPTLFLTYINDITNTIPRQVSNTLPADDLAVWSASEHTTTARYIMPKKCEEDTPVDRRLGTRDQQNQDRVSQIEVVLFVINIYVVGLCGNN